MSVNSSYLVTERTQLLDGPLGAILLLASERADGQFALVEHTLSPRALGAPLHTHRNEDEYSLVVEGTVGVEIGGEVLQATAGRIVLKPRRIPHAFWNPTDRPVRLLDLIVPGGFERYFADLHEILGVPRAPGSRRARRARRPLRARPPPGSIPRLAAEHRLDVGPPA